jgi:hypothetical protein
MRFDETDGWIYTDAGHSWLNAHTMMKGWSMAMIFTLKDDEDDGRVEFLNWAYSPMITDWNTRL